MEEKEGTNRAWTIFGAVAVATFGVGLGVLNPGCAGDTGADDDSGLSDGGDSTTGFEATCPLCIIEEGTAWLCGCGDQTVCAANIEDAEEACVGQCDAPQVVPCYAYSNEGSCSAWSPAGAIDLISGVYEVDEAWLLDLLDDPAPVWTCDDAYFLPQSGGGFKLQRAVSGDLLYELGLRTNDVPISLNGYPLLDYEDVAEAFTELHVDQGETEFTLIFSRGGSTLTYLYELV